MRRRPLVHNPSNPITVGIWREEGAGGSPVVRKVVAPGRASSHPDWSSSDVSTDWRYWRREVCVYESGLHQVYAPEGLAGPEVWSCTEADDGSITIRMAVASGRTGADLGEDDLVAVAARLGQAQGRLAATRPERPWLSRGFLRDHIASKQVSYAWLHDDRAWGAPLVREHWPAGLPAGLARLHQRTPRLLHLSTTAPRTLCHLDLWSHNLFVDGESVVVLDWACCGDGALGEDVSNLVMEAVLDGFLQPERLQTLATRALDAYVEGVLASGWRGEVEAVRMGFLAAAVKWVWLGPLHLQRAVEGGHHVYGGQTAADPAEQYRARGHALEAAVAWADEAVALGERLLGG